MPRKYYDAAAEENGGGFIQGEPISLSEVNASYNQEPAEEPAAEPVTETPSETEASPETEPVVEQPAPEQPTETIAEEPLTEAPPAEQPETIATPAADWKEVLKTQNKSEVLKELGIPDLFREMIKAHESGQDVSAFYETKTRNWDAVADEDLVRHQLRKEYSTLSDEEFNDIVQDELETRFKIGESFHDDDVRRGKIRLKAEAAKIREGLKAEQAAYQLPKVEAQTDPEAQRELQTLKQTMAQLEAQKTEAAEAYKAYEQSVKSAQATQRLLADKRLVYGSGDSAYHYDVQPEALQEQALNTDTFFQNFRSADGTVDFARFYKAAHYAANMEQVEKALIEHGMSLGSKSMLEEYQNPSKNQVTRPTTTDGRLGDALANGVPFSLGNN